MLFASSFKYIVHFYYLVVEASFYSDKVECLPVDPLDVTKLNFFWKNANTENYFSSINSLQYLEYHV